MASRFRKLGMEQMEERQMMAGDLIASLDGNGNLTIAEDPDDIGENQSVIIKQLADGRIRVEGDGSEINGDDHEDFRVTGSLIVNLGDGNDEVLFEKYNGRIPSLRQVEIAPGIFGGAQDNDVIRIEALHTSDSLFIFTGAGVDRVELDGVAAGDVTIGDDSGRDRLSMITGAGADQVTIKDHTRVVGEVWIKTYDYPAENDADVVYFDTNALVENDVTVLTGAGNDSLLITRDDGSIVTSGALETHGSLLVEMGAGNDKVYARGLKTHGDLQILTGTGQDNVTLDNRVIQTPNGTRFTPEVYGNIDIQTYDSPESRVEKDADQVRIFGANVRGSLFARLGGGNDYFLLDEAGFIGNDLHLAAGADTDTAIISGFVVDQLMARMGDGDDTLTLKSSLANHVIADGGAGVDSLTSTDIRARYFDRLGWEFINGRRQPLPRANIYLLS